MSARGYYSVIQYCPDRSRLESANVGVVLFSPELGFLDAKLVRGHDRIRRFFGSGSFDPRAVEAAKRAIANRLRHDRQSFTGIAGLEQFIATRANALSMTPARPMRVVNAAEDLKRLFTELVGGRVRKGDPAEHWPRLEAIFRSQDLQDRVEFGRKVTLPVVGGTLTAPYAYRNGVVNLVKPVEFSPDPAGARRSAMRLAVEGDLIHRHSEAEPARLIVVPDFPPEMPDVADVEARIRDLFHDYHVRTVSPHELDAFADEVRATAH